MGLKKAKKKGTQEEDKFIYEKINGRQGSLHCSIARPAAAAGRSATAFAHPRGGEHVKWIADDVAKKIIPLAKKAFKGVDIKASQIKHSMFIFINALISNPSFDSQTKETLTTVCQSLDLQSSNQNSRGEILQGCCEKFRLVDEVLHYARAKVRRAMERKMGGSKKSKLSGFKA